MNNKKRTINKAKKLVAKPRFRLKVFKDKTKYNRKDKKGDDDGVR